MRLVVIKKIQESSVPGSEIGIIKDAIRGDTILFQDGPIRYLVKLSDLYDFIKKQEDESAVETN